MAIPVIAAAIGAAASLYQVGSGIAQKRKAKKLAEKYERQHLENVYKNLGISTAAEEAQMEGAARRFATEAEALGRLGARGAGMAGDLSSRISEEERRIAASIDQKQKELQAMIASDEARKREIQEQRDIANIQGIGQLGAVGGQNIAGGLANVASSAGQFARLFPNQTSPQATQSQMPMYDPTYNTETVYDYGTQNIG